MPFEKHDQVSEKRSKNTDFGVGNLVEISDAENHSDLVVLPENCQKNSKIMVLKWSKTWFSNLFLVSRKSGSNYEKIGKSVFFMG